MGARVVHASSRSALRDGYIITSIHSKKGKKVTVSKWSDIGSYVQHNADGPYNVSGIDSTGHDFSVEAELLPGLYGVSACEDVDAGVRIVECDETSGFQQGDIIQQIQAGDGQPVQIKTRRELINFITKHPNANYTISGFTSEGHNFSHHIPAITHR